MLSLLTFAGASLSSEESLESSELDEPSLSLGARWSAEEGGGESAGMNGGGDGEGINALGDI